MSACETLFELVLTPCSLWLDFTPIFLLGHACLDLRRGPRNIVGKVLIARLGHPDDVFDAHSADFRLILSDLLAVQIAQIELVEVLRHFTVEKEITEVATRLNRDHVSRLYHARGSQVAETR